MLKTIEYRKGSSTFVEVMRRTIHIKDKGEMLDGTLRRVVIKCKTFNSNNRKSEAKKVADAKHAEFMRTAYKAKRAESQSEARKAKRRK